MANIANKFGLYESSPHFTDPWLFVARTQASGDYSMSQTNDTASDATTVQFWTNMTARGVIETNDLTANVWITIASLSGKGLFAGVFGPTSGGADTTTFGINVNGAGEVEYPILNAAGQRASLSVGLLPGVTFTTSSIFATPGGDLNAAKTILGDGSNVKFVNTFDFMSAMGTPMLRFDTSLVVRVKHSQNITNSTATAYKGMVYRMGLA